MKPGDPVTINLTKETYYPSAMIFKKFEIMVLRHGTRRKDMVFNMIMEDVEIGKTGTVILSLRRLNIVSWWPGREIQLWGIRKAFKNQQ